MTSVQSPYNPSAYIKEANAVVLDNINNSNISISSDVAVSSSNSATGERTGKNSTQENVPANEIDYRKQGGPLLRYLWCSDSEPLSGQTLYLGGEVGSDNCVYYIPGHAPRVLRLDPQNNDKLEQIGPVFPGKFKWLRGVRVGHVIYGLPCHADCVLRIDMSVKDYDANHVTTIPIPYSEFYSNQSSQNDSNNTNTHRYQEWKYHGGNICPIDGCIYAIPQSAMHVLKIDPVTDTCHLVGPALPGRYKWYGGVVSSIDNALYGIPHDSPSVLRIHPTQGITLHGNLFPVANNDNDRSTGHQWHGAAAAPDGIIVCVPANADQVLCITPTASTLNSGSGGNEPIFTFLGDDTVIKTGRHRSDKKYKYLGATAGNNDGKVYIFPSGSEHVLQVDTATMTLQNLEPDVYNSERLCQNKWQNGVAVGSKYVYGIPLAAESLLRIDTTTTTTTNGPSVSTWHLPRPFKSLAKFEGGVVVTTNGKQIVYTVPNNFKAVLRIEGGDSDCESNVADYDQVGNSCCLSTNIDTNEEPITDNSKRDTSSSVERNALNVMDAPKYKTPGYDREIDKSMRQACTYQSGIPTLRSSAHRVKLNIKNRKHNPEPVDCHGNLTDTTWLPEALCKELVFAYDASKYDLANKISKLLQRCDEKIVGKFNTISKDGNEVCDFSLENFVVEQPSTWRSVNGGQCEDAQRYLSEQVENDAELLQTFDEFVQGFVLPHLKQRLVDEGALNVEDRAAFYYQRPPTLRLQPGPAWAQVKAHNDAEYGHQNGELNYWIPFTDRAFTGVDLHCESSYNQGDYHAVVANPGEIISFHGSSCRHFVNANSSAFTRVSMDFRVGVQGFFDPYWQMKGTTDDHGRMEVKL